MTPEFKTDIVKVKSIISEFVIPLVSVVISLVLVLLIIVPAIKTLPVATREVKNKQEQAEVLKNKIKVLEKLVDFKSVVDEDFMLLTAAIPSESQVPQLLTQIDQISKESGLSVVTMSYTLSNTLTGEVDVTLTAGGNYDQIVGFLSNLEKSSRIVELDNLRYGENKDTEGNSSLLVTFVLKSPYLTLDPKVVTIEPLSLDITEPRFIDLLNKIKGLKVYKYSIEDLKYKQVSETTQSENK